MADSKFREKNHLEKLKMVIKLFSAAVLSNDETAYIVKQKETESKNNALRYKDRKATQWILKS